MDHPRTAVFPAEFAPLWRQLLGASADTHFIGVVSRADALVIATVLASTLLVSFAVALILRRFGRATEHESLARGSLRRVVRALGKPLHVLIWASGLHVAIAALITTALRGRSFGLLQALSQLLYDQALFVIVVWLAIRLTRVLERHLVQWAAHTANALDDFLLPLIGASLRTAVPVIAAIIALPWLHLPARFDAITGKLTSILMIAVLAAVLLRAVHAGARAILARHDITVADNLRARKIHTQVGIIAKVVDVAIVLLAIASVLMLFDEVRRLGTSLLASAGVAGIILGMAAQKTIANLLAGFQIALTQPIREDDVLIVEGEWGRVEEITLTYVVVRIWDERRLVLPLSYFIEHPFQNWTRSSANRLGSVYVWVDYSFPVMEGREVLRGIIEGNPLWDGRFWNLVVSDASERTMQLRILATAKDASTEWDLRCDIRERFIAFLRDRHPDSLPQLRLQSTTPAAGAACS
ncbi:MAG: mechanosensitive ion channel [Gammaproteobacteria bacterium]|nr:mechanosensitive ion channel [Gammaproteobacteria bacterium]